MLIFRSSLKWLHYVKFLAKDLTLVAIVGNTLPTDFIFVVFCLSLLFSTIKYS
jgi:hypothetical protein